MANQNIFQQRLRPVLPSILQNERVFVYVPKATSTTPGISFYPEDEFTVASSGKVTLKWPMSLQIENKTVNDPLNTIARVKLSSDEFVHTNEISSITHPLTKLTYSNTNSSLKLKRTEQDAFKKPSFIMIDDNDFEASELDSGDAQDAGRYVKYILKKNNPLEQASLVKLNSQDFSYTDEAIIRWPYAHDPSLGTNRTNEYGLVKIQSNSEGYLKFEDGYLIVDKNKVNNNITPVYGGKDNGFEDYDNYVTSEGIAKQDNQDNILLKLTKDAIGLSKVENKSFNEYRYSDFGTNMKNDLSNEFLNRTTWNKLFRDWETSGDKDKTVETVFSELRAEDESLRDIIRTNRAFLGVFEDEYDLQSTYPAGEWTYGSSAYLHSTKSYWKVTPNNVSKVVEGRAPVKSDVPDNARDKDSYKIGRRDTNEVYQWNIDSLILTEETLDWIDTVVMNEEDIQAFISSHASEHFFEGYRLGCRETGVVIKYTNNQWVSDGTISYHWVDAYLASLSWISFRETNVDNIKPNGIPTVGSSGKWLSSDHVHPTDETRLAKSVFDNTNILVTTDYTGLDSDFKVSLSEGGDKQLNIPYIRMAKSLYNYNNIINSENAGDYYWSGTKEEYNAQAANIQNQSILLIDDEITMVDTFVTLDDIALSGLSINTDDRFLITTISDATSYINTPLSLTYIDGKYKIKSLLPSSVKDGRLVITKISEDTNPTYDIYESTNKDSDTLIGLKANGTLFETIETNYVKTTILDNQRLVVAKGNGRDVKSLTSVDYVNGGIIVADGNGAIKSTSFTSPGKLLQTSGTTGNILAAEISVDTLVRSAANEFNDMGIVISTGTGEIERQDLGVIENQLIVTDGANGLKAHTLENESLLYIDNNGKVKEFPSTVNDAGRVLMVQSNGKIGIQNLPDIPTHLPVTSIGLNTVGGTKLHFGQTSVFEEGVLYLW